MSNFPMEIMEDLFLRLPATALVRCRFLSKPCLTLIDKPEFITSHLNRTLETGDHLMILLRGPRILRTVYLESPDKVTDVDHPLQSDGSTEVFGSCNGLVGLLNSPTDLAIFNPSTRRIHKLPYEPIDLPKENKIIPEDAFYGLGYDSVNDDYKVVRMIQSKRDKSKNRFQFPFEIKVFNLKKNSWKPIYLPFQRQIHFIAPYYPLLYRRGNGVLASNSLHWILPSNPTEGCNAVVGFDLDSEELGLVCIPMELLCEDNMDLGVLDGLLCLMCYDESSNVDIWVMKEYKGEWSKEFRVPKPEGVESVELLRPLMYSKDRTKILMEINNAMNLMWFDLESKEFTRVGIKDCDSPYSTEIVVSSLVLGCNGVPRRARKGLFWDVTEFLAELIRGTKRGILTAFLLILVHFLAKWFKLKL